jgi:DNA-binding CsgD family transcriptional regulator
MAPTDVDTLPGGPCETAEAQAWSDASTAEDRGVVLLAAGRTRDAAGEFERALERFDAAASGHDCARVRARLRSAGVHPKPVPDKNRPVFGWESLTSNERDVAQLVADGLTNREVATRMFLSRHTVDFHLRSIFRKLAISSRVQLARITVEVLPVTAVVDLL